MDPVSVVRYLTILVFAAIAVLALGRSRQQGGEAAKWFTLSFVLLAAATLTLALVPDESRSEPVEWVRKLTVGALALFPYFLFRFAATFRRPPQAVESAAKVVTAAVIVATLAVPQARIGGGTTGPTWLPLYVGALALQWTALSVFAATALWRAGRGQPGVSRRRMRTLSLGAIGLALALLLAGASDDDAVATVIRLLALASGCLFFLGFAPPPRVRRAWRRSDEARLRGAAADLVGATTVGQVTASLLPHVTTLAAGRAAALVDLEGRVVGSHGSVPEDAPALAARFTQAPFGEGRISGDCIELALASGRLFVWTGAYAPFFGRDELDLLRSIAALADLAFERCRLHDVEHEERERRLREEAARVRAETAARMVQRLQSVTDTALVHLDLDDLLTELLARIRDMLQADTAAILLIEGDGASLAVRAATGLEEEIERRIRIPLGEGFAGRIAAERRPIRLDAVREADVVSPVLIEKGVRSLLGAPLLAEGRVAGVIHVGTLYPHHFTDEEVALLQLVAERAALAIDRARLYEQEHGIAETLQRSLLPEQLPELPGIKVAARYLPAGLGAAVGGDWYDAVPLPHGRLAVAIGDVVGHGTAAASLMGELRNALRAYVLEDHPPAAVLDRLNRMTLEWRPGRMATLLLMYLEPDGQTLRFSNAGHIPPLLLAPDGSATYLEDGRSVPVGVVSHAVYREAETSLEPGSILVMFTDGLVERRGSTIIDGLELVREIVGSAPKDPRALCEHVMDAVLPAGRADDDIAMLSLELVALPRERVKLRLNADPRSVGVVRRALRRWLEDSGVSAGDAHDVLLACGEACSNAVEHAYSAAAADFEASFAREDGSITITVRDFGSWREGRGAARGRGLGLMQALMDEVKVEPGPEGTLVTLRRRVAGDGAA